MRIFSMSARWSRMPGPVLLGLLTTALVGELPSASAAPPKVTIDAVASVTALAPDQSLEVAFQFDIEKGWHIYWLNSGDAGLPPEVTWEFPPGFSATPLLHPTPQRHTDPGDLVTFIHEGRPILVSTITPPGSLPSGKVVELNGEVDFLVCKRACIKMAVSFRLSLPVADAGAQVSPANQTIFAAARRRFPEPISAAKFAKIKAVVNVDKIRPDDAFKLAVVLEVDKGSHIQSHQPLGANYIATDVFLEPTEGIEFGRGIYPAHHVRTLPGNIKVAEYSGRVVVQFDARAEKSLVGESARIAGVVRYQACNEAGQCFRPQNIQWEITVPVGEQGEPVRNVGSDFFGGSDPSAKATDMPAKALQEALTDGTVPMPYPSIGKGLPILPSQVDSLTPDAEDTDASQAADVTMKEIADSATAVQQADGSDSDGGLESFLRRFGLPGLLAGCFLYGLFLNATPCVLPLLSIKVLGFVQQAHESRRRTMLLGLSFGIGVVLFFIVLGFIAAAGRNLLQFPVVIIGLGAIVTALSLSMLGVYTLKAPDAAAKLDANITQEGILASFGKGALAPILGFACTGPLLAGIFGWATAQEPHVAVFAFVFTGLGMASPYVLLGANPNWLSFLPKPGNWMITFERIMGFVLLAMVIWLIHPLVTQIGSEGLEWTLAFFVAVAMACWVLGKVNMTMPSEQRWRYRGCATALILVAGGLIYGVIYPLDEALARQRQVAGTPSIPLNGDDDHIEWQAWSEDAVRKKVLSGKTVFVDFTAAWCTVCKVNKKVAINTPEVLGKMQEFGISLFRGDFTLYDEEIAGMLKKHSRAGVPLNLIYPAGKPDHPILLRPNLAMKYLLDKLQEAGPSATP